MDMQFDLMKKRFLRAIALERSGKGDVKEGDDDTVGKMERSLYFTVLGFWEWRQPTACTMPKASSSIQDNAPIITSHPYSIPKSHSTMKIVSHLPPSESRNIHRILPPLTKLV
jgi:hypothetical protein